MEGYGKIHVKNAMMSHGSLLCGLGTCCVSRRDFIKFGAMAATLCDLVPGVMAASPLQFGPAGGRGNTTSVPYVDSPTGTITKIVVHHAFYIDSIKTFWTDGSSSSHGGNSQNTVEDLFLIPQAEYLTTIDGSLTGRHEAIMGGIANIVASIRFTTNLGNSSPIYGPSGPSQNPFSFTVPSGNQILGFLGSSGNYIDSIGVLFGPTLAAVPNTATVNAGPSGGPGGSPFVDRPAAGATINKLIIHHGLYIDSIQTFWTDGTTSEHGSENQGSRADAFQINASAGEYLSGIDGRISTDSDGGPYVSAIRFTTNMGNRSQLYGSGSAVFERGYQYSAPSGSQIAGFLGRSGIYIDAIGVLISPVPTR